MNDILIRISDLDLEYLLLFADIGIAASEDFNDIDNEAWQCNQNYRSQSKILVKELKDLIKYEQVLGS